MTHVAPLPARPRGVMFFLFLAFVCLCVFLFFFVGAAAVANRLPADYLPSSLSSCTVLYITLLAVLYKGTLGRLCPTPYCVCMVSLVADVGPRCGLLVDIKLTKSTQPFSNTNKNQESNPTTSYQRDIRHQPRPLRVETFVPSNAPPTSPMFQPPAYLTLAGAVAFSIPRSDLPWCHLCCACLSCCAYPFLLISWEILQGGL